MGEWKEDVVGWGGFQIYSRDCFVVHGGVSMCVYGKGLSPGKSGRSLIVQDLLSQGEKIELYPECGGEHTQGRREKGGRKGNATGRPKVQERRK